MQAPAAPPPACPPQWQWLGRRRAAPSAPRCAPKGDGCLLQLGVRGHSAVHKQSHTSERGTAERVGRQLSEQGRGEGQHHAGLRGAPKSLSSASTISSALTSNLTALVMQATSFVPSRMATQVHVGGAPWKLKGTMGQVDRDAVCPTPPSTRFVLWWLPRQTLPDLQNFLPSTTCSALGSAMGLGSIKTPLVGKQAGGAPVSH